MVSRSKVETALDALKDTILCSDKGDKMQSIVFKFEKLCCTERLNSLKQKYIIGFFKAI